MLLNLLSVLSLYLTFFYITVHANNSPTKNVANFSGCNPNNASSIVSDLSLCGDANNRCSGAGQCAAIKRDCDDNLKFHKTYGCFCNNNRYGVHCEKASSIIRRYSCKANLDCNGNGICTKFTERKSANGEIKAIDYRCRCYDEYTGLHCHKRVIQMLSHTTSGDAEHISPQSGGYFSFKQRK